MFSLCAVSLGHCARHCGLRRDAEMDHVKYLWPQSWRCKATQQLFSVRAMRENKELAVEPEMYCTAQSEPLK